MNKYLIPALFGLFASVIFTACFNHFYTKSMGVVHLSELIGSHVSQEGSIQVNQTELKEKAKAYSEALTLAIASVSEEHNVILVVAPAIISPIADYTELVNDKINLLIDHD